MPVVYPNHGPGFPPPAPKDGSPALPSGSARPYPYGGRSLALQRLVEPPSPMPKAASDALMAYKEKLQMGFNPMPATPPAEEPMGAQPQMDRQRMALAGLAAAGQNPQLPPAAHLYELLGRRLSQQIPGQNSMNTPTPLRDGS